MLTPMSTTELRRVIEEPARKTGVVLEPGLVDLLLRDVAGEPVADLRRGDCHGQSDEPEQATSHPGSSLAKRRVGLNQTNRQDFVATARPRRGPTGP